MKTAEMQAMCRKILAETLADPTLDPAVRGLMVAGLRERGVPEPDDGHEGGANP